MSCNKYIKCPCFIVYDLRQKDQDKLTSLGCEGSAICVDIFAYIILLGEIKQFSNL